MIASNLLFSLYGNAPPMFWGGLNTTSNFFNSSLVFVSISLAFSWFFRPFLGNLVNLLLKLLSPSLKAAWILILQELRTLNYSSSRIFILKFYTFLLISSIRLPGLSLHRLIRDENLWFSIFTNSSLSNL